MTEKDRPQFLRPLAVPGADIGQTVTLDEPVMLDCGRTLSPVTVAFQTYGTLNAAKTNAILACHALSGDQFVAGTNPVTGKPGWWPYMVGPGLAIDTRRFFVICANVLGGCMGSTGPASIDPATGKPYGADFPFITVADMVRVQAMLLDRLGIERLLCVTGGSMGGMQALEWAARYPERVVSAMPIATAARHTAQNIALHEVGRQAIMSDPDWRRGRYQDEDVRPSKGLSIARMIAHISYLSEAALERKFGRNLQGKTALSYAFAPDFQVESYLHHQGSTFVDRFDANSYLYITRAMDYFDLAGAHGETLANAFRGTKARFQCVSFTSDWLFPTSENRRIVDALTEAGAAVDFREIESDKGHDAFLLEEPELFATVRAFLESAAPREGAEPRR
jgi:homoserine O-acetyltransferase